MHNLIQHDCSLGSIAYFHPHRHAELDSASPNKKTKTDAE
jgi:hypothetical protein